MEQRVAKLDAGVGDIKEVLKRLELAIAQIVKDVSSVKERLAGLEGRVSQMPTTWQLITGVVAIFAAAFTLLRFGLPH